MAIWDKSWDKYRAALRKVFDEGLGEVCITCWRRSGETWWLELWGCASASVCTACGRTWTSLNGLPWLGSSKGDDGDRRLGVRQGGEVCDTCVTCRACESVGLAEDTEMGREGTCESGSQW